MKPAFDHEKLEVYQESLLLCGWAGELLATITAKAAAKDQLDRASTSIPLNIAEGNGKFSGRDRARFFEVARGSALECAACLDVLAVRKLAGEKQIEEEKERLVSYRAHAHGIVAQIFGPAGDGPRRGGELSRGAGL